MLYPGNIKKEYKSVVSYKNRGMTLEYLIEKANIYYRDNDIAYIYKKPTLLDILPARRCQRGGEKMKTMLLRILG